MSSIVKVDTIQENTSANGITVDGLNIKDSKLVTADSVVTANITDLNITSGKIADDAITLAKMAPGTDGNLITYDASGNPAAVATGSAGQVLTSAGAGAPPTFATLSAETNTPSFYATGDGSTNVGNATLNRIANQREVFDNGGCYNHTSSSVTLNGLTCPDFRFTPNVAGLYYFIGAVKLNTGTWNLGLVNNLGGTGGTESYASLKYFIGTANNTVMVQGYSLMNGSGNNMVLAAYQESGGSIQTNDAIYTTYFGGFLVKKS